MVDRVMRASSPASSSASETAGMVMLVRSKARVFPSALTEMPLLNPSVISFFGVAPAWAAMAYTGESVSFSAAK